MAGHGIVAAWAIIVALVFASNGAHGWDYAHATFYGDIGGGETMSKYSYCRFSFFGSCFSNIYKLNIPNPTTPKYLYLAREVTLDHCHWHS